MNAIVRIAEYSYITGGTPTHNHDCCECSFVGQIFKHPSPDSTLICEVVDVYLTCGEKGLSLRDGSNGGDYEYMKLRYLASVMPQSERWTAAVRACSGHHLSDSLPDICRKDVRLTRKELKQLV